jgi:hypothetical protein
MGPLGQDQGDAGGSDNHQEGCHYELGGDKPVDRDSRRFSVSARRAQRLKRRGRCSLVLTSDHFSANDGQFRSRLQRAYNQRARLHQNEQRRFHQHEGPNMGRLSFSLPRSGRLLASVLLSAFALGMGAEACFARNCDPTTTGIDTSYGDCHSTGELGEGLGQSFFAPDTLISAITVWRAYYDTPNDSIWHIYILPLDSVGVPDVATPISDGPTLRIIDGDGEHDTPFRFAFDPPLRLPSPGEYEFAIQGDGCRGVFQIVQNCSNAYPSGMLWVHDRVTFPPCHLRGGPASYPTADLVFTVEFCQSTVPTLPVTLGKVKAIYR